MHTLNLACQSINLSKSFPFLGIWTAVSCSNQISELKQHQKKFHSPNTLNKNQYYFLINIFVIVVQTYLTQEIQWKT